MFPRRIKKYAILSLFSWIFLYVINNIINDYDQYIDSGQDYQEYNLIAERRDTIQDVCSEKTAGKSLKSTRQHLYRDSSRELLYCAVPGASSGFMLRVLAITKSIETDSSPVPFLNAVKPEELLKFGIERIPTTELEGDGQVLLNTKNYYKFIFVRNPFARILSIYLKEFSPARKNKNTETKSLIKRIKRFYGDEGQLSFGISFKEFLRYVIDDVTASSNGFWRPVHNACAPCIINYDFIGKLETFDSDFYACLEGIQDSSDPKVKIIIEKVLEESNGLNIQFEKYWKTIPLEQVHRFIAVYKMDFILFGYASSLKFYFSNNETAPK